MACGVHWLKLLVAASFGIAQRVRFVPRFMECHREHVNSASGDRIRVTVTSDGRENARVLEPDFSATWYWFCPWPVVVVSFAAGLA